MGREAPKERRKRVQTANKQLLLSLLVFLNLSRRKRERERIQ